MSSQIICELCDTKLLYKRDLHKHQLTERCKTINQLIKNKLNEYITVNKDLQSKNEEITNELIFFKKKLEEKNYEIKSLQEKSEEYRKIVEKAATKSTKTNVKNSYNYLNLISSEPIKFNEIKKQLKEVVNYETLMYNDAEFNECIVDNILKDENGKDKVLCTDINRKNFSYKDEKSGEIICDPELEKLRDKLKKGADIKSVKKELLNKLIEQYDNTETCPYTRFAEIIKKLDFGNPFVDHVAKKTYIKTKSNAN